MKKDAKYNIVTDIHDEETGNVFKKGMVLYRTHGVYYVDGMMMTPEYQDQFDRLTEYEEKNGLKYLEKVY